MWDVKTYDTHIEFADIDCFTLTMWDVKQKQEEGYIFPRMFYLNYVGCKVGTMSLLLCPG